MQGAALVGFITDKTFCWHLQALLIFRNSWAFHIVLIGFHDINNEFSYTLPADI
jgi:hypothetical protein